MPDASDLPYLAGLGAAASVVLSGRGDTGPGQNKGNGLNAFGGLWREVTTSGSAPADSSSSGSDSGGY
jgi:hypothetical protein